MVLQQNNKITYKLEAEKGHTGSAGGVAEKK
jgi:hypothetical protein